MDKIQKGSVSNWLIRINVLMALVYLGWWFYLPHADNKILYGLLFFGEIYHVVMAIGFWFTIKKRTILELEQNKAIADDVAIFITVAGEPVRIVEQTVIAAKQLEYPRSNVYILNDGYVAQKNNWQEIEKMAEVHEVTCITRKIGGGAKAGNINNALKSTHEKYVAILDADMVPNKNFLQELMPYFTNENIAFVQSPQYYKNHYLNNITAGAWEQQKFFFGPIMQGKDTVNSAFICGTNVVIKRLALMQVGGMNEKNIAEDFLTSLAIHNNGWKSVYVPKVLCEGLAPEDLLSYYKQQQRWARGSLEVLFKFNPFFTRRLSLKQRIQYLLSALYYLNGLIVLIDISMPILYLFFGLQPVAATTTSFALFFIPYIFSNLYTLYIVSGESITFRAMSFSQASWTLQLTALMSLLLRRKVQFAVTEKQAKEGNFIFLIYPHLVYILLAVIGVLINLNKSGGSPTVVTNAAWATFNVIMFLPFIRAAYHWEKIPHLIRSSLLPKILINK